MRTIEKTNSTLPISLIDIKFKLFDNTLLICFGILILLFFSCSKNDKDKDGVIDKKDKCPNVPANTKDGCPPPKEIGKVFFYLETSASMGGYFKGDADFKTIVSDLTTKIEKNIKPIDIWFIAEAEEKYSKSTQQFSIDLATTKIAKQKSSELHKIIANIVSKKDSNDVILLVSDCILSFPDKDIKSNPEINKQEAPNALKNNIYSTFADLKKQGIATSIYAFNSKFYGTYYNYQNVKTELKGNKRPFYLWVIADHEILVKFNTKLNEIPTFKPEKSLHFGENEGPVNIYDIIPQIERKGTWMKCREGLTDIETSKTEPLQFCVALNLENLPVYAKDITYLQANLEIESDGCEVSFEVRDKSNVDKSKLKSQPQIKLFEAATHVIIFTVSTMALSDAKIIVTLPLHYDTWYLDWSCIDDKDLNKVEGKSFALENLITGVKDAYETKNKNYINFSLTLKK